MIDGITLQSQWRAGSEQYAAVAANNNGKNHTSPWNSLAKNSYLIKLLYPDINIRETESTEEHAKPYVGDAISIIQSEKNSTDQRSEFLQHIARESGGRERRKTCTFRRP